MSRALIDHIVGAVRRAPLVEKPFHYLQLEGIFPRETYVAMMGAMPSVADYRAMSGRSKSARRDDGTPTRVKIDLFPEFIRHLPPAKRVLWRDVGRALRSAALKDAFVERLGIPLQQRFGPQFAHLGHYATPILTRDTAGYQISTHSDTHWKAITVQLYLPADESIEHVGTVFHEKLANGEMKRSTRMRFAPNSGYAFAVGDDTWHSVDLLGQEVKTRDSILLTYFLDAGPLRILRNRAKRLGNMLRNELRYLART
ncbi:MAG TPA: hypothetical protein VHQ39_00655 [Dongiaceae bacterium]|jgi:hypothetical protein|nr:hypothetical protein [Dongiaceae bacterium]